MFKQHLIDHVTNSLADLAQFIEVSQAILTRPVADDDYEGLVECIEQLSAVKERTAATDEMFEPLKDTIELLRQYGQELPEEVHDQLQVRAHCDVKCDSTVRNCRSRSEIS